MDAPGESRTSRVANVFEATSKKDKSRYLRAYFPNLKTRDEALTGGNVVAGTREHPIDIMRAKDGGDSDSEIEIEFESVEEILVVVTDLEQQSNRSATTASMIRRY